MSPLRREDSGLPNHDDSCDNRVTLHRQYRWNENQLHFPPRDFNNLMWINHLTGEPVISEKDEHYSKNRLSEGSPENTRRKSLNGYRKSDYADHNREYQVAGANRNKSTQQLNGFEKGNKFRQFQPPRCREFVNGCYVSWYKSPEEFAIRRRSDDAYKALFLDVQIAYVNRRKADVSELRRGDCVVVRCDEDSDEDPKFYRARVTSTPNGDAVKILLVDFGEGALSSEVWHVSANHCALPVQAISCCLANVKPKGGRWPEIGQSQIEGLFEKEPLRVQFLTKDDDDKWRVKLVDGSGVDFAEKLIESGLADSANGEKENRDLLKIEKEKVPRGYNNPECSDIVPLGGGIYRDVARGSLNAPRDEGQSGSKANCGSFGPPKSIEEQYKGSLAEHDSSQDGYVPREGFGIDGEQRRVPEYGILGIPRGNPKVPRNALRYPGAGRGKCYYEENAPRGKFHAPINSERFELGDKCENLDAQSVRSISRDINGIKLNLDEQSRVENAPKMAEDIFWYNILTDKMEGVDDARKLEVRKKESYGGGKRSHVEENMEENQDGMVVEVIFYDEQEAKDVEYIWASDLNVTNGDVEELMVYEFDAVFEVENSDQKR